MSRSNKRYVVLQDSGASKATVTESQSFTVPDDSLATNVGKERFKFSEVSRLPSVKVDAAEGSDLGIASGGAVDPQFASKTSLDGTSELLEEPVSAPRKISGSGLIQTGGSASTSRYTFVKEGQGDYQLRSTYNSFNKVTQGLERNINQGEPQNIYCRPTLLPLKNGNLLCGYLDNMAQPWAWTWRSSLINERIAVYVTDSSQLGNLSPGDAITITCANGGASVGGAVVNVDTAAGAILMDVNPSNNCTISNIFPNDTITVGAYTFFVDQSGADARIVYSVWQNSTSGSGRASETIRLRLQTQQDRFWSTQNSSTTAQSYPSSTTGDSYLDRSNIGSNTTDKNIGMTGLSMVQYEDTEEVLVIYTGFKGDAPISPSTYSPGFLCVDSLDHPMDTLNGFSNKQFRPSNRGSFVVNQPGSELYGTQEIPTDVEGLTTRQRPLDLTAQIMPTGRLVVCILYEDSVWSLVSDDRGVSFRASQVMDLTFGENELLRMGTIDSVNTKDGSMAILICCNGLGDRGYPSDEASAGHKLAESVLSIFVSVDGVTWGREKKLGGGLYQPSFGEIQTGSAPVTYPFGRFPDTYFDQNLFCLSASICLTPEGTYLVSAVGYNQGGPGNAQSQQLYQRVLQVEEILSGQDGETLAPTLPPQIYDQKEPFVNDYQRLIMAKYQPSIKMDDPIGDAGTVPGTFPDWPHPVVMTYLGYVAGNPGYVASAGYLGQAYFACLPVTGTSGWKQGGGGPLWSQGPIDLATCLWRDSVVTVSCGLQEFDPVDWPNSEASFIFFGKRFVEARRESYVEVLYSGGFQPINCRVPNNIRWWARGFTGYGITPANKLPLDIDATLSGNQMCYQLGGNGWQVTYNAPRNPFDQSWKATSTGVNSESFVHLADNNRSYFRGLMTTAGPGGYRYYSYAEWLTSSFQSLVFPNAQGEALIHDEVVGGRTFVSKESLGFICRVVVSIPYAGLFDSATRTFSGDSVGVKVKLQQDAVGGYAQIQANLRIGYDINTGIAGFQVYDPQGLNALVTVALSDPDINVDITTYPKFYEVIFCAETEGANQYASLAVRRWSQHSDTDWTDDYEFDSETSTPFEIVLEPEKDEHFQFGIFEGSFPVSTAYWSSVQFSRNFIMQDAARIDRYTQTASPGSKQELPMGLDEFRLGGLIKKDLSIDVLQDLNGGLFAPSSPSKTSTFPQMLDSGITVSFLGRSASSDLFEYLAKSTMPTEGIFSLPSSTGWRSISDTVDFETPNLAGSPVIVSVIPDYELTFDFGSEGVLPESVAFFGINTDEVCVDFYDNPSSGRSLTGPNSPSLSAWFSSPGGNATKIWNTQTGAPTTTVDVTYKPNYIFYWQNYDIFTGAPVSYANGDLVASLDASASPNVVRFKSAGYDSGDPSIAASQGRYTPFVPNQFRSESGCSFYLVVYAGQMSTDPDFGGPGLLSDWSIGTDCRFRHVFKIKDNGSDHLILESDIASHFTLQRSADGGDEDAKIPVGSMTIISDRVASNLPDFFPDVEKLDATSRQFEGMNRYRFLRLRIGGGKFYSSSESYLKMGMMIAGSRISLSSPDIAWGWNYDMEFGNSLYTGITGQRRKKKNHRPRREWTVSYAPRPSESVDIHSAGGDGDHYYYENPSRGYGKIADSTYPNNTEQMSARSKMSWMEAVQRVLTLEVDGDVMALAFEGDNMVNNHSLHTGFPSNGSIKPAASSPDSIVAARLVGYGGAVHDGYQSGKGIGNQMIGESTTPQNTSCTVRPVVSVSGLKFSEEL